MNFPVVGFGSYRTDISIEDHYDALSKALLNGIDLIDTSANYYDGGSEQLIGKVLTDLLSEGKVKREDITLVTKAGYIQGQNYRLASQLKKDGKPFPEVVEFADRLWHCIHPEFLEDQINRQLQRLNQDHIDVYLLHNPEYYLQWAKDNGLDVSDARENYYERIRAAFVFLEKKVEEGKIKCYGISSNTFVTYSNEADFTSLEKVVDVANSVSDKNNFKVIQLPFNLFEAGAMIIKNQINNTETVLELAERTGLKVLVNRPMNAVTSKGLVRLSDFHPEKFEEKDFIKQMKLVGLMEDELVNDKLTEESIDEADMTKLKKFLSFGKLVDENWKFFGSIEHFNDIVQQLIAPRINYLNDFFAEKITNDNLRDFFQRYIKQTYLLLNFVSNYYKLRAKKRSEFIKGLIDKEIGEKFKSLTLSQKSVLLLSSIKGVSTVLVGMRKEKYVDDMIPLLETEKIPNAEKIIRSVYGEIEAAEKLI